MKNEIRVAANAAVENLLTAAMPNLIPVRVAKKDGYAIDTGMKDENGNTVYAVVEVTVKNTEATKTAPAFDLDAAIAARQENDEKPKKVALKKDEPDPEKEARAAKREQEKGILLAWCAENLSDEPLTATNIKDAVPEMAALTVMAVGSHLKALAAENPGVINRTLVGGKVVYTRA
jgi:hypothetical protein